MTEPIYTGQVHTTAEGVLALLDASQRQPQRAMVVLMPGDTTWNPASTKADIVGPGTVYYVRHPDGGIDASVS